MERSLIKEVNKVNMQARLTSYAVKPTYYGNFFNVESTSSLKWETLIGKKGVPVMADVISFDASAPEKTRETIAKASGDIPKIAIKRSMNEGQWNKYQQLLRDINGRANLKALLDLAFEDLDFVYNGVRARMEWLAMQIFSSAALTLSATNNIGLVTETDLDFGVPAANKSGVSVSWASLTTSDPLGNIEAKVTAIRATGNVCSYIVLREAQWLQVKNATETLNKMKAWIGSTSKVLTTLELVNSYMTANRMPQIVVIDPAVRFEDAEHTKTAVNPFTENRVVFVPDLRIGTIQHGPIAAENSDAVRAKALLVKQDFILTTKWAELEPFKEWTKAEANAFPVLDDPETLFYLRTDNATW